MEEDRPQKTYVAADVMRRRKQDIGKNQQKAQQRLERIKKSKEGKKREVVPVEEMVNQYKKEQTAYSKFNKRKVKTLRSGLEGQDDKIVLVVRIRGVKDISTQQKKILSAMSLPGPMCATFLKLTKQNINRIKKVENYITYGTPSRKLISELIYKRCFGRIDGKRVPITSNKIVEEHLGDKGIICLQDLIVELSGEGDNFDTVRNFLYSFKLNTPKEQFDQSKATLPFNKGGEWGDREQKINDLVFNMI
ncbi:Ribosomal protein L30, ferredoxin-like fold domain [Pseudocohnilembus persalinus]|uniref:Ribosomal protein L30, ferredoxin-like fold domain n=1 Tax=Pseudocohnilembus persalinus TaxID=266149 RepID=A0A0V0QJI3_PSEPJ|nr:Ribosomal protein L30, ferredoxin-like fold domain [Pseudocohnilembus persalinus]|eukprot:KRX02391.1 Ribosomal protein L30, ferredoxin-like fold domain [Pseudocohnilembus persalinus]